MGNNTSEINERSHPGKLVLPSLAIAGAPMEPPGVLTNLLLIEIGLTFGCHVGLAGQIKTTSSTVGIIMALAMGLVSVKFRHKSLLTVGLLAFALSALGCSFATDFNMMFIFYSISGLAGALVGPMTNTLVGELFPLDKRSSAIGILFATRAFTYLTGAQIIGFIGGVWGWRIAFLGFVFPLSLLSLLIAVKGIPSGIRDETSVKENKAYMKGIKSVFTNRSAIACLVGNTLSAAAWVGLLGYSSSFFRERFQMPRSQASLFLSGVALCFMVSSYLGGRLVNKFGRKRLTNLGIFLFSFFAVVVTNSPTLWLALTAMLLTSVFSAVRRTSIFSLTLEQIPKFRGTMMSLNQAFYALGSALGSGVGGIVLLLYDWEFLGVTVGAVGFIAALIIQLIAIDPTRN